jgi:uracil DNA glycosylase
MNYHSFPTFQGLLATALNGVQREWLEDDSQRPTRFRTDFETTLRGLYISAAHVTGNFLPEPAQILEPFKWMKPSQVKVIITAQDPYPRAQDAAGIAFHSLSGKCPLSARRINQNLIHFGHIPPYLEELSDYRSWLSQGVLLTNVSLTTKEGVYRAHGAIWKGVIQLALQLVPKESVALLLGQDAGSIMSTLTSKCKIEHAHPAARDDEFMSRDIFREVNECLVKMKLSPIDWIPGPAR